MSVASYWREIPYRYRLEAGKCSSCGKILFPKRQICPECRSRSFSDIQLNPSGKLLTYTIIHVAPSNFSDQIPYALGIVELQEGVRLLTQISDCNPENIRTGMPVEIEFRKISENGSSGIINYGYKGVPKTG